MTAPVERRHRELAYNAVEGCDYYGASSDGRNWIDGQLTIGEYGLELAIAQALADIEAPLLTEIERLKTWTKCSERMPDMSQLVAAWCSDFVEPIAGIITPHHDTLSKRVLDTALGEGYGFEYFTHWMPLPEPPK